MCRRASVHVCVCVNYNVVHVRESLSDHLPPLAFRRKAFELLFAAIDSNLVPPLVKYLPSENTGIQQRATTEMSSVLSLIGAKLIY